VRATPRTAPHRYRRRMGADAVFVWIILGLAVAVLVLITLYVDSWRRKDDA
jgi:heme exporter protein D